MATLPNSLQVKGIDVSSGGVESIVWPRGLTLIVGSSRERSQGYRDALVEASIPYDRSLVEVGHNHAAAAAAVARVLAGRNPVTAVFAAGNLYENAIHLDFSFTRYIVCYEG